MNSTFIKITTITAISAAAIFGLAACSSGTDANKDSDVDNSSTSQLVGPIVVDVATLEGTDVTVNQGQMIDITTGNLDPATFTAKIADTKIATFTAGGKNGSATFNPGITGVASGMTKVALTDSATGKVYNFTVTVN
ncbi:hypothetical protein GCM10027022_17450 [Alpinimonas psychrophila]|uniref:Uncharacterized protein n=1 Tax=Alpinimonas psychrophila TaxID=748908 RepID=A0A7W3PPD7_9MICO|nr:hypothetical protein [Alpinimonas psychrophila]MBA8829397.1 hypothetical protein [Alpinimonas psychrophila]